MLVDYVSNLQISESSKKVYNASLKRLLKLTKSTDIKVILDTERVLDAIKDIALKSRQIMHTAIVSYLKANDPNNEELLKFYRKHGSDLQHIITNKRRSQCMDKDKVDNFITKPDLKKISKKISHDLKFVNKESKEYIKLIQHRLIINLYHQIHARLDFGDMLVVSSAEYNKLSVTDQDKTNFLIKDKNKYKFMFNHFKNVKSFGKMVFEPTRYGVRLLNEWFKLNPTKYLLITLDYKPMTRNNLSSQLKQLFKKYLNKPNATLNSLRHGMISKECQNMPSIKETKKNSDKFFHSRYEHQLYRHIEK